MKEIIAVPNSVEATAVEDVYEDASSGSPVVVPLRSLRISRRAVVPVSLTKDAWQMTR